ncbi:MAG: TRAP transporter large permease subunit [Gemmatimonadota bacterium]
MTAALAVFLALLGTPLFAILAGLALASFMANGTDLTAVFIEMYRLATTPALTAVPLFALGGFALAESGAARRLVRISETALGWLPGGLAIMALAICALLTAFTGASGMTIVAVGGLLYPALRQGRYPESFTLGLLTTSGSLGLLFPPSLALILYAIVSGTPVDELFMAGILPGLLLLGSLATYAYAVGRRRVPAADRPSWRDAWQALRAGVWELLLPVVVIGGVYGGFIAVSEAASLSALYILVVEMVVHRELRLRQLPGIVREAMLLVGAIIVILAAALAYTSFLVDAEVPNRLLDSIGQRVHDRFTFLVLLNLFLLVVGCAIDMFSALIVIVPIILPIASAYGVHPVHLGIIFLTNLEIGYSTPPVGLNLFIASARFGRPVLELYRASLPFLGILLVALLVITYVPELSLCLISH